MPEHIRSDNDSENALRVTRTILDEPKVDTLYIEPGSPWENGCMKNFIGNLGDVLLSGEIFAKVLEAKVLVEQWRRRYNRDRPHSSLGYRSPAPDTFRLLSLERVGQGWKWYHPQWQVT